MARFFLYILAAAYPVLVFVFLVILRMPVRFFSFFVIATALIYFLRATSKKKSSPTMP
jgi:membrane protein implicated in regulation of membrane protease activity